MKQRKAVILVLVLLFLALCSAVISQTCSYTLRLASQAAESQRELQERWAIVSIRTTLLDKASEILQVEQSPNELTIIPSWHTSVVLQQHRYEILLQDENAKFPLPAFVALAKEPDVRSALRPLIQLGRLRSPLPASIQHWNQIFFRDDTLAGGDGFRDLQELTQSITLYSNGRINPWSAPPEVLNAAWQVKFGTNAPDSIQNIATYPRTSTMSALLQLGGLASSQAPFAESLLTHDSNCYSIWIQQNTIRDDGFRGYYIRRREPGFADDNFGFHWP